jgi:hypothetical protein
MANLIIKPTTGGSLVLQDEGGDAALTVGTTGISTIANASITTGTIASAVVFPVGMPIKVSYYAIPRGTCTETSWPADDTIPQRSEGAEIFSQAYTPSISGCDLRITAYAKLGEASNVRNDQGLALHISDNDNALQVQDQHSTGGTDSHNVWLYIDYKMASWGATAKTFSLRCSQANRFNYSNHSATYASTGYGQAAYKSAMVITEIKT